MAEGSPPEPQDSVATVLSDLWAKRRPDVVSDLGTLRASMADAMHSPSDQAHRDRATAIAHRLHGALAVFGFATEKDRLAAIETELRSDSVITATMVAAVETVLRELPR